MSNDDSLDFCPSCAASIEKVQFKNNKNKFLPVSDSDFVLCPICRTSLKKDYNGFTKFTRLYAIGWGVLLVLWAVNSDENLISGNAAFLIMLFVTLVLIALISSRSYNKYVLKID